MKNLCCKLPIALGRLAELFPRQNYQSELDHYISKKHPKDAADVERYTKEFEYKISQGKFI